MGIRGVVKPMPICISGFALALLFMVAFCTEVAFADTDRMLADGEYSIASFSDDTEVLDVVAGLNEPGTNVTLWESYGEARQRYAVRYVRDGLYCIIAKHSGQALDVVASGQDSGTNVTQWTYYGGLNQLWRIEDAGDGAVRFVSACNGLYLSRLGTAKNGTNVVVSNVEDSSSKWYASPLSLDSTLGVSDGVYEIVLSAANGNSVAISDGASFAGANAAVADRGQRFRFERQSDGCYLITSVQSGQSLDVVASGMRPETNVTQWPLTYAANQRWMLLDCGDGQVRIVSSCNGLSLTAQSGLSSGSNVAVSTWKDDSSQRFSLVEQTGSLEDGIYYLCPAAAPDYALDVVAGSCDAGANVTLWNKTGVAWQRFKVERLDDGYYSVQSLQSGQVLDVVASGQQPGTNVTQWPSYSATNQKWSIVENSNGTYSIVSACNGLPLTSKGVAAGSNVCVGSVGSSSCSEWMFDPAPSVEDGRYTIALKSSPNFVFDVVAGSAKEGANVTLWEKSGVEWQDFEITYVGGGYYKVIACHSGQSLDVVAAGSNPGTNVTQWRYFGNDNQLWEIIGTEDAGYVFRSKCNGLYLTVDNSSSLYGANVFVDSLGSSSAQRFLLKPGASQNVTYVDYGFSVKQLLDWQRESKYATYSDSTGLYYLDPQRWDKNSGAYLRFADLRGYSGLSAYDLDAYISSTQTGRSGTLVGHGSAFVAAAKSENVNEAFVLATAILESGWGTSWLATGTYYDGNGFWCRMYDDNGILTNEWVSYPGYSPGTYYNYYGIGAVDSAPNEGGIKTAIRNGWNSVDAAVLGGAKWIASNYVYAFKYPQETLYEMRWDVDRSQVERCRGWHQYSTNIKWDVSIAEGQLASIYSLAGFNTARLSFIVPRYQ